MIEKKTIIDSITVTRSGELQVKFGLLLVEDGKELAPPQWHRTMVRPGDDPSERIADVNAHLVQMGKAEVDSDMIPVLEAVVTTLHTPEVVQAFRDREAAAAAPILPPKILITPPERGGNPNG